MVVMVLLMVLEEQEMELEENQIKREMLLLAIYLMTHRLESQVAEAEEEPTSEEQQWEYGTN